VWANLARKSTSKHSIIELLLAHPLGRIKKTDAAKLQDEYAKLVAGLQDTTDDSVDEDAFMTNPRTSSVFPAHLNALTHLPVLPDDLLKEAIPGNIRKAEHFVAFLKRFVEYLKVSPLTSSPS
jgi:DNA excision repair protein ERCC-2